MPQSDYSLFSKNKTLDIECNEEASLLQKQLGVMEGEVKEIQLELAAIKRDRLDILSSKRTKTFSLDDINTNEFPKRHAGDESDKFSEVAKLHEELIIAKKAAEEERFQREKYEGKLKDLELKLNNICGSGNLTELKISKKISEEEVTTLKTQIRDLREETEELNLSLTEKTEQLQEYRNKYLQAQQHVEELRRQLEAIEYENKQVSDQIHIEIQKMKMQFQEKLQELAPLPDLLKGAQIQMQEAKQLQRLAEDSSQELANELHRVKEKLIVVVNSLNQAELDKTNITEENAILKATLADKCAYIQRLSKELSQYEYDLLRAKEKVCQAEAQNKEKERECAQLHKNLEELKHEDERSLNRYKERSESVRRYLQSQISELERQLVQTRALCKAKQKERDEVRQRVQDQINNLQENFEIRVIELHNLRNQIKSLKNCYPYTLVDEDYFNETTNANNT